MEEVIPGLYASPPETLPFAPSLEIRAFLLRRDPGNLLVYGAGTLTADTREVEGVGGVWRHYLNHRHEAAFVGNKRDDRISGAPLFCHENERRSVSERLEVSGTFSERHLVGDDFEVIPIPGHTRGATAYLWETGEHRCLFTGDTVYLRGGEWVAAVLPSSDRETYVESLELIRELDFDVLVPWVASAGEPYHDFTDEADTRRRIDAILKRVRRGGEE
jgi:glyoxylase-like metal-dependent hydrolase (beta-lactamase superfamily II)